MSDIPGHVRMCPATDPIPIGDTCNYCALIGAVRMDTQERLLQQAATATVTSTEGLAVLEVEDPHDARWVPVSVELITTLIARRNADAEEIRADERARLRRSVETLGGYIRKPDEYVPVGVILTLLGGS